jgi:HD-GYP domain-containing protein (c-di-GMP phosphodiesterase class II)
MLKKIPVRQLEQGMYIQKLCGSWMEHPFWRTSFKLKDAADLQRIRESGVAEVWIDVSRGSDVAAGGRTEEEVAVEAEQRLGAAAVQADSPEESVPIGGETARASRIIMASRAAVVSMFNEARLGKAVDANGARPMVEEIAGSVRRNRSALISLARLKRADDYTYMHSVAVCALMISLARQLGLDEAEVREAGLAGLVHDIGKIAIPGHILNKPGKLDDAEFSVVRNHPVAGHAFLLGGSATPAMALDVCLHHHEKMDGSGYPHRLPGEKISLHARMGAVCDVYDAITSDRPYKKGWDPAHALRNMAEWSKGHFDEAVFQSFVKSVGIYPVGSLVRLQSGRVGVIVEQSGRSLLTPKVRVFLSAPRKMRIPPELVDLGLPGSQDTIAAREDPALWNIPDLAALSEAP